MVKTIQEEFLYKKSYEFSYAVLRIASSAKNREIAELLETKAILLLDSILTADYEKTKDMINSIITITGLMVDSGILHPVNREILISESERINLAIEALPEGIKTLPDLNLSKIFSKTVLPIRKHNSAQSAKTDFQSEIADSGSTRLTTRSFADIRPEKLPISRDKIADKDTSEPSSFKSETRQSAIIEKLRQSENLPAGQAGCRLNELQAIFPDVSERTLRYDLESLISKGLVERIGSRRNSFYKIARLPSSNDQASGGQVIELPAHSETNPPGLMQ